MCWTTFQSDRRESIWIRLCFGITKSVGGGGVDLNLRMGWSGRFSTNLMVVLISIPPTHTHSIVEHLIDWVCKLILLCCFIGSWSPSRIDYVHYIKCAWYLWWLVDGATMMPCPVCLKLLHFPRPIYNWGKTQSTEIYYVFPNYPKWFPNIISAIKKRFICFG